MSSNTQTTVYQTVTTPQNQPIPSTTAPCKKDTRLDTWTWIWFFVAAVLVVLFIAAMSFYQRALTERVDPKDLPGGVSSIDFAVKMNSVGNAFRTETRDDLNDALEHCLNSTDCNSFSWNDTTNEMLILTSANNTTESDVFTTFWR